LNWHGGGGVPRIVQPSVMYTGLGEECLPLVVVGVRVERATVRVSEYPPFVVPELPGGRALGFLHCLVGLQQHD
jgi:hypothetical protein